VFASVDKGGGHTELENVFKLDAVICGIEGAIEVGIHDVEIPVVEVGVLHHHDDGGESVVNAAVFPESIMLVAKDAVGFCVL
jgi:hypothetical protein